MFGRCSFLSYWQIIDAIRRCIDVAVDGYGRRFLDGHGDKCVGVRLPYSRSELTVPPPLGPIDCATSIIPPDAPIGRLLCTSIIMTMTFCGPISSSNRYILIRTFIFDLTPMAN